MFLGPTCEIVVVTFTLKWPDYSDMRLTCWIAVICGSWIQFICVCVFMSHHFFVRTEPLPGPGRSRRVNLLLTTARRHSWPPGNTQGFRFTHEEREVNTDIRLRGYFILICLYVCFTFMSVSLGMWSLKSSTELTRKGIWQDNTWRERDRDSPVRRWSCIRAWQEIFKHIKKNVTFVVFFCLVRLTWTLVCLSGLFVVCLGWCRQNNQIKTFWKGGSPSLRVVWKQTGQTLCILIADM